MINYTTVKSCLSGLVGYRNSDDSCQDTLTGAITGSSSGRYITDISGITPEYIAAARGKDYADLQTYLDDVFNKEPLEAVKAFIRNHKELTAARHLVDNADITKKMHHFVDQVTKSGRFVGVKIQPAVSENIVIQVRSIGVQFSALNPALTLYVFESSQNEPIKTITLTGHNKTNSLQWFDQTDVKFYYKDDSGGTGQEFYIGYFEDDLNGMAVDTRLNCGTCPGNKDSAYIQATKHMAISGVNFNSSHLNGTDLPNTKQQGLNEQTYGLHLKLNVTCDITSILCDNIAQFDNLVTQRIAMRIFKDFYNTAEIGGTSEMSRNRALTNLEMAEDEFKRELKALELDFTQIDKICLPCKKKSYKTGQLYL